MKTEDWGVLCYVLWTGFIGPLSALLFGPDIGDWITIAPTMAWFFVVFMAGIFGKIPDAPGPNGERHWAGGCDGGE